jgi:CHAD domain-containing protein
MAKAKPVTDLDIQAPTSKNARVLARTRLDELYSWSDFVDDPYRIGELHDLRIAAKRLRYSLEIFEDVLPEFSKEAVNELTQLQNELGELHDSDVMIALLRICLGIQDGGSGYENALTHIKPQRIKGRSLLEPGLMAVLLDHDSAPSAEERYGLEWLLKEQQRLREQQYAAFRQHWYTLQARDFRRLLLAALDTEEAA